MNALLHHFFVPIMGFSKSTRRVTGIERLWRAVRETSGPDAWIIHPQRWNLDSRDLAALIARNAHPSARIVIVGHSWGIGWGAMRLARALGRFGMEITDIVSADGVYRSPLLPGWLPLNPLSLGWRLLRPRIPVPHNVRRIHAFVQHLSLPRGHGFRVGTGTTVTVRLVDAPHGRVDELEAFREAAVRVWVEGLQPHCPLPSKPE